jgi:hypothetical protein
MPIDPFIEYGAFGPEATAAMGEAFDAACKELGEISQFKELREFIAARILAAARGGELDPVRLRTSALGGLLSADSISPNRCLISYMQVCGAAQH